MTSGLGKAGVLLGADLPAAAPAAKPGVAPASSMTHHPALVAVRDAFARAAVERTAKPVAYSLEE